jgi:hypothetical protein
MARSAEDGSGTTETRKPVEIVSSEVKTPGCLVVDFNLDSEFK